MYRIRHIWMWGPYLMGWVAILTLILHGVIPHHHHVGDDTIVHACAAGEHDHSHLGQDCTQCYMENGDEKACDHFIAEASDDIGFTKQTDSADDCNHSCDVCHFDPDMVQAGQSHPLLFQSPFASLALQAERQVSEILFVFSETPPILTFYRTNPLRGPPLSA